MRLRYLFPIALLLASSVLTIEAASAPKGPSISLVVEGRSADDHRSLLRIVGRGMNRVDAVELLGDHGTSDAVVRTAKKKFLVAEVPQGLQPGAYRLVLVDRKGIRTPELVLTLRLGGVPPGSIDAAAVDAGLLAALGNVSSVQGNDISFFVDAGNLETGTLSPERYSALEDLDAEAILTDGGELVPAVISARQDLQDEGRLDEDGNLDMGLFSAWSDLVAENVASADGVWSTDHFSARDDLLAEGHLDVAGRLHSDFYSAWSDLVDEGYVDGDGHLAAGGYSAYASLEQADRIGSGEDQVAAGLHDHDDAYLSLAGGEVDGQLNVGLTFSGDGVLVTGRNQPMELLRGEFRGTDVIGYGIWAILDAADPNAVSSEFAIHAKGWQTNGGIGILGRSDSDEGCGIFATTETNNKAGAMAGTGQSSGHLYEAVNDGGGIAMHLECIQSGTTVIGGGLAPSSANLPNSAFLVCKDSSGNVARIDAEGQGYFNGGTATSGADFAESVRVDTRAKEFAPGDVVAIDRAAVRGFTLCRAPRSHMIAGVVSTKPGILAMPRPAATPDPGAKSREIPLAIAGIVPVKVCDENGPIRAGDTLVSASEPGYAMRAGTDAAMGTIIGKALGALREGRGTVEVLLTLQ